MRNRRRRIVVSAFGLLIVALFIRVVTLSGTDVTKHDSPSWLKWIEEVSVKRQMPLFRYLEEGQPKDLEQGIHELLASAFPWYAYEKLYLLEETRIENAGDRTTTAWEGGEETVSLLSVRELAPQAGRTTRQQKEQEISFGEVLESYRTWDREQLLRMCYTVDATTSPKCLNLDVSRLCEPVAFDVTQEEGYQILIYHTHGSEKYAKNENGQEQGVMEAGQYLAELLEQRYGYRVLHLTECFDAVDRDSAYANALPVLEQTLKDHPQIQVMIDLHRDEVTGEMNMTSQVDGHEAARFMFFHGLSYTNERGQLDNLPNPYLEDSMAFSFKVQAAAEAICPGITRKTYLKGYRYNMHLRPASLLIELGSQNTTGTQALQTCVVLAKALDVVLCYNISR